MTTFRLAGVEVPRIGLGTNRLTTAPEHVAFVREAVAAGLRHIDTAHLYREGESERAIGRGARRRRRGRARRHQGRLRRRGPGPARDHSARRSSRACARCDTDAIGLFYLHEIDPETPLEESLGAIKEYVDRGAIRHVGISNVDREQVERARQVVPIAAVQNHYNLEQRESDDVIDLCEREGIAFVPYYPLRAGGGPEVAAAAAELGVSETTVKLAELLRRSPVVLPIPGHALDRAPAREPRRARTGERVMTVLLYGDTIRYPALRHEVPLAIMDPFLFADHEGRALVLTSSLETSRIATALPEAELLTFDELGLYELVADGVPRAQAELDDAGARRWSGGGSTPPSSRPTCRWRWRTGCARRASR